MSAQNFEDPTNMVIEFFIQKTNETRETGLEKIGQNLKCVQQETSCLFSCLFGIAPTCIHVGHLSAYMGIASYEERYLISGSEGKTVQFVRYMHFRTQCKRVKKAREVRLSGMDKHVLRSHFLHPRD